MSRSRSFLCLFLCTLLIVVAASASASTVGVSVAPTSSTVPLGGTQQFSATVTGTTNQAVSWSASGGTISSTGLYTAPTGAAGQVAFDAVGPAGSAGAYTGTLSIPSGAGSYGLTWSHTIGSDPNRVLIVGIVCTSNVLDARYTVSVTYNGVAMTAIPNSKVHGNNSNYGFVQLFGLGQASLPAAGAYPVQVTVAYAAGTADTMAGAGGSSVSFASGSGWRANAQTAAGNGATSSVAVTAPR